MGNQTKQKGMTIVGMLFLVIIIGFLAVVVVRVIPAYMQNRAIVQSVQYAASDITEAGVRQKFTAQVQANGLSSNAPLQAADLQIKSTPSGSTVSYAYEREIPLVGNISLLLKFSGTYSGVSY